MTTCTSPPAVASLRFVLACPAIKNGIQQDTRPLEYRPEGWQCEEWDGNSRSAGSGAVGVEMVLYSQSTLFILRDELMAICWMIWVAT
jgi:hypothetical protein